MVRFRIVLHFICILSAVFANLALSSSETEAHALLEFKNQLTDPLNYLSSWTKSISPCHFAGILCDPKSNEVTTISLRNLTLSGKISPSISILRSLTYLDLGSNSISGILPPELANCTHLKLLNLSYNTLTGKLPDLSGLKKLEVLDLSLNSFSGPFPAWVGSLAWLKELSLAANNFEQGKIPENIGNLKNLTWLFLASCNFIGEIPASIFELSSLGTLDLSHNQISGKLPKEIANLRDLYKIELYQNNFTGEIPVELANLSRLREFDISRNQMSGELPAEIGNLNFTIFQIYQNNFWGEFPKGFGDMQYLTSLSIYENKFSGDFPENLGRFSPLNAIDISENNFSGAFPKFLCQNNNLQFLLALDNNFSGEFPENYDSCKTLQRFRISQNKFSGKISSGLWGLPFATIIDVADNDFNGVISSDIGFSSALTQLYVQNNKFSGELPAELGKLAQLQKLVAFNNLFSGQIPPQLGNLIQLTSLHLEVNSFLGSTPGELGNCSRLVDLDLAENSLSGNIPETLSALTSLNSLNISNNLISGPIPDNLQLLKLSSIDFSKNKLSGVVPSQLLMIAGKEAFSGNAGLCIEKNTDKCSLRHRNNKIARNRVMIVTILILTVTFLLAGFILVSYKNFKLEESNRVKDTEGGAVADPKWILEPFHLNEITAEEICNLDEDNLIGSGSTGKVYRLDLNKNRGTFAVKQLYDGKGANYLMDEIDILKKIKHKNVLKLHACLTRGNSNFLVFEYMPNGNLYQALQREVKGGKSELDWIRRHKIAVGAAKGLMYLHHDCSPAILHRDIKSSNILLDEEYEAKIADFGIAKFAEQSNLSCFAGTHGYIAPEIGYSLKVTEKSDVYSFGVVLLELLTSRSPTEHQFGNGKDIVYWVSSHLEIGNIVDVLDPRVLEYAKDDMMKVLRVAILCTAKLPSERPSMREVVNMLIDADPCKSQQNKNPCKSC